MLPGTIPSPGGHARPAKPGAGIQFPATNGNAATLLPPDGPAVDYSIRMPTGLPSSGTQYPGYDSDGNFVAWASMPVGVTDHGELTGLADDDHPQYALLAGRTGGQTIVGGETVGQNLTLLGDAAPFAIALTVSHSSVAVESTGGSVVFAVRSTSTGFVIAPTIGGTIFGPESGDCYITLQSGNYIAVAIDEDTGWMRLGTRTITALPTTGHVECAQGVSTAPILVVDAVAENSAAHVLLRGRSSTTVRSMADTTLTWVTSTDATRKARLVQHVYDTLPREAYRIEADGTQAKIGFLGAVAVARPDVTGSRTDGTALASLITALESLGLITDSTTA